jgi:anti-sigma factor RsiW
MNNDTQLKVQAYLDNELTPAEARKISSLISCDSEARDLYARLKETKQILGQHEPTLKLDESRDFYWSKIQRGIETAERLPAARPPARWWVKILAPMAGAVALFALLISIVNPISQQPVARNVTSEPDQPLHEMQDLAPDVSTITYRSEAEGVTVVWINSQ